MRELKIYLTYYLVETLVNRILNTLLTEISTNNKNIKKTHNKIQSNKKIHFPKIKMKNLHCETFNFPRD